MYGVGIGSMRPSPVKGDESGHRLIVSQSPHPC